MSWPRRSPAHASHCFGIQETTSWTLSGSTNTRSYRLCPGCPSACLPTTASSVASSPWDRRWMAASMNSSMTSRTPLSARQAPPATPRSAVEARQSLHREDRSLLNLITPRLALSSSFADDHIGSYIVPRERVPWSTLHPHSHLSDRPPAPMTSRRYLMGQPKRFRSDRLKVTSSVPEPSGTM